jgi:hypothetical protein
LGNDGVQMRNNNNSGVSSEQSFHLNNCHPTISSLSSLSCVSMLHIMPTKNDDEHYDGIKAMDEEYDSDHDSAAGATNNSNCNSRKHAHHSIASDVEESPATSNASLMMGRTSLHDNDNTNFGTSTSSALRSDTKQEYAADSKSTSNATTIIDNPSTGSSGMITRNARNKRRAAGNHIVPCYRLI